MAAPRTYVYPTGVSTMLDWDIKFERGVLVTEDPHVQRRIERHPEFLCGRITVAKDGEVVVEAPGFVKTTTEMTLGAVTSTPQPALPLEPIPEPSRALLKANGIPVPDLPIDLTGTAADASLPELPAPSVMARKSLERIQAIAVERGFKGAINLGTKDEVLGLLYPPQAMVARLEAKEQAKAEQGEETAS